MNSSVQYFYDQSPENEWNRLVRSPYRKIEFEVISHFLSEYLPPSGTILDLGGGPGRYTISLAQKGYRVTLIDVSPKNIELARQKIQGKNLLDRVERIVVGDEHSLSSYPAGAFDAVLCMGPLYHLQKEEDRLFCLQQCVRVLKPQSPIFVTLYPRLSYLHDAIRSGTCLSLFEQDGAALEDILAKGYSPRAGLPNTHFCNPDDVIAWFHRAGLEVLERASVYGPFSFQDRCVEDIAASPQAWNRMLNLILDTCTDPHMFSSAEYLLAIGEKP
jgi:S-adenosylmethionine-dependent methyltransferase